MRAVIQRVTHASVTIEGKVKSQIEQGYLILLGICNEDTDEDNPDILLIFSLVFLPVKGFIKEDNQ